MADAWLPAAGRMPAELDGGALTGGAPRAVWFTSESDPGAVSARSVAHELRFRHQVVHLVWNPLDGDIVQMVAVTRAGNLLQGPVGGEGRICAQIMVVGHAREPFTDGPLSGLDQIMSWLDSWHVPRHWPAGPPLPPPQSYTSERSRRSWARGGHFGCSQVPGTNRPDPGRIDIWKITGPDDAFTGVPQPRMAAGPESVPARDSPIASGDLLLRGNGAPRAVSVAAAAGSALGGLHGPEATQAPQAPRPPQAGSEAPLDPVRPPAATAAEPPDGHLTGEPGEPPQTTTVPGADADRQAGGTGQGHRAGQRAGAGPGPVRTPSQARVRPRAREQA